MKWYQVYKNPVLNVMALILLGAATLLILFILLSWIVSLKPSRVLCQDTAIPVFCSNE